MRAVEEELGDSRRDPAIQNLFLKYFRNLRVLSVSVVIFCLFSVPFLSLRALLAGSTSDGGEMHHFFFGCLGPGQFPAQPAVTHDQDAIGQRQHFWKIT
jgi:hypothetical protein